MTCPACGFSVSAEAECPRCGIVFAKWLARKAAGDAPKTAIAAPDGAPRNRAAVPSAYNGPMIQSKRAVTSDRVLARFFSQMSALLDSGVSVQEALGIAGGASSPRAVRRATGKARAEISRGATLQAALDAASFVDREAVALLGAAEKIGNLAATFAELARGVEQRTAFRRAILIGLAYPAILVVLAIFSLPLKVLVFEGPARYLAETLPPFGIVVGAVLFATVALPRVLGWMGAPMGVRDAMSAIPLLGRPWRALRVARFARSLGRFLDAGAEIREALESAAQSTGQRRFTRAIDSAVEQVAAGATLAAALSATRLFGADFVLAVDGAERSGRLPQTLLGVARAYEEAALHHVRLTVIVGTTSAAVLVMAFIGFRLFGEMQGTVKGVQGVIDSVLKEAGGLESGVESLKNLEKLLDE